MKILPLIVCVLSVVVVVGKLIQDHTFDNGFFCCAIYSGLYYSEINK